MMDGGTLIVVLMVVVMVVMCGGMIAGMVFGVFRGRRNRDDHCAGRVDLSRDRHRDRHHALLPNPSHDSVTARPHI